MSLYLLNFSEIIPSNLWKIAILYPPEKVYFIFITMWILSGIYVIYDLGDLKQKKINRRYDYSVIFMQRTIFINDTFWSDF